MKLTPLQNWVLVRNDEPTGETSDGIIIPDSAQEKPERGEVLAIGAGRFMEDKGSMNTVKQKTFVKTTLTAGEHILYKKYAAKEVEDDEETLVLVREEDVLGALRA